jgi:hypothetical protein
MAWEWWVRGMRHPTAGEFRAHCAGTCRAGRDGREWGAVGIDAAHRGALAGRSKTVAILVG